MQKMMEKTQLAHLPRNGQEVMSAMQQHFEAQRVENQLSFDRTPRGIGPSASMPCSRCNKSSGIRKNRKISEETRWRNDRNSKKIYSSEDDSDLSFSSSDEGDLRDKSKTYRVLRSKKKVEHLEENGAAKYVDDDDIQPVFITHTYAPAIARAKNCVTREKKR